MRGIATFAKAVLIALGLYTLYFMLFPEQHVGLWQWPSMRPVVALLFLIVGTALILPRHRPRQYLLFAVVGFGVLMIGGMFSGLQIDLGIIGECLISEDHLGQGAQMPITALLGITMMSASMLIQSWQHKLSEKRAAYAILISATMSAVVVIAAWLSFIMSILDHAKLTMRPAVGVGLIAYLIVVLAGAATAIRLREYWAASMERRAWFTFYLVLGIFAVAIAGVMLISVEAYAQASRMNAGIPVSRHFGVALLVLTVVLLGMLLTAKLARPLIQGMAGTEADLAATLQSLPVGVITVDGAGRIERINPMAMEYLALEGQEWQGRAVTSLFESRNLPGLTGEVQGGYAGQFSYNCAGLDGKRGTSSIEVTVKRYVVQGRTHHLYLLTDVTKRTEEQRRARRLHEIEHIVSSFAASFSKSPDTEFDVQVDLMLRRLGLVLNAKRAYILKLNASMTQIEGAYEWCAEGVDPRVDEYLKPHPQDSDESLIEHCMQAYAMWPPATLSLPIMMVGALRGFLVLESSHGVGNWDAEDQKLLRRIAELVGNEWQHWHYLAQIRRTMEVLQDERALFMSGRVVMFRWRVEPTLLVTEYVSDNVNGLLGYQPMEFMEERISCMGLQHPNDAERVKRELSEAIRSDVQYVTHAPFRVRHRDGHYLWVYNHARLVRDQSERVTHVNGYIFDITDAKENEEAMRMTSHTLQEAQRLSNVGSVVIRQDGCVDASEELCRIFGGKPIHSKEAFLEGFRIADRVRIDRAIDEILAHQQSVEMDCNIRTGALTSVDMHLSITAMDSEDSSSACVLVTVQDVTELRMKEKALRSLATHIDLVREHERKMVAHDLHDDLGQVLTAIKMRSESTAASDRAEIARLADHALDRIRAIVSVIRPATLELGFVKSIESLCSEFQKRFGIRCLFEAEDEVYLPEQRAIILLRVIQEALNNIAKHAQASQAGVNLAIEEGMLIVRIRDDGAGFNPKHIPAGTLGQLGMEERVRGMGGQYQLTTHPGKGTRHYIEVPLEERRAQRKEG